MGKAGHRRVPVRVSDACWSSDYSAEINKVFLGRDWLHAFLREISVYTLPKSTKGGFFDVNNHRSVISGARLMFLPNSYVNLLGLNSAYTTHYAGACVYPNFSVGEQGWRSGERARLPPMCPGFNSRTLRHIVGWVCCWLSNLLREGFLRILRLSPLLKNQHF